MKKRMPILTLALPLLCCLSCELFSLDAYAPQNENILVSHKLGTELASGSASLESVNAIRELPASDGGRLAFVVYTTSDKDLHLAIYNAASLSLKKTIDLPSKDYSPIGRDALGNYLVGSLRLDSSLATTSTASPAAWADVVFIDPSTRTNLLVSVNGTSIAWQSYDSTWTIMTPSVKATSPIDDSSLSYEYRDALTEATGDGSRRLLLYRGKDSSLVEFILPGASALPAALVAGKSLADVCDLATVTGASGTSFLTEAGIIGVNYSKGMSLYLYQLSDGTFLSSKRVDSDFTQALSFNASGKEWYYFDTRTQILYELAAWWN
jgi:hypothetical protein